MKVLIVKKKDSCFPFVEEQTNALRLLGVESIFHLISGRGVGAYIRDIPWLWRDIVRIQPDIIHAHYGMSGLYACLVAKVMRIFASKPVVVTYHGSDINVPDVRKLSQYAIQIADYNIFVSPQLMAQVKCGENSQVIPCGIDWRDWTDVPKQEARKQMGLDQNQKTVLFCSDFDTPVKNPQLAKDAIASLNDVELVELKGYSRAQVNLLMHAADVALMTSYSEGSPQFIKEAMACSCPIVTTRVGDAEFVIGDTMGCYFTDYSVADCAVQITTALHFAERYDRTNGKQRILQLGYCNDIVAKKINDIYVSLTQKR